LVLVLYDNYQKHAQFNTVVNRLIKLNQVDLNPMPINLFFYSFIT
jgi:hypothetical protein